MVLTDAFKSIDINTTNVKVISEKEYPILKEKVFSRKSKYSNFLKVGPAVFQECDVRSRNNRIYPYSVIKEAVDEAIPIVKNYQMIGELDHLTVNESPFPKLSFASHLVTSLSMDGKKVVGEAVILRTPYGDILRELLESGVRVGVSVRGVGDVEEIIEGRETITKVKKFRILSYEFVSWPGFDLYVTKDQTKKVESIFESEAYQKILNTKKLEEQEQLLLELFKKYKELSPMGKLLIISKLWS